MTTRREMVSLLLAAAAWPARAAPFPSRAVRRVVPYSVGVGPDVVARSVAERLAAAWGRRSRAGNTRG